MTTGAPSLQLTAADLAEPVTRALGVGHVDVVDWRVESMKPGTGGATGGLYRIEGSASATEVPHTWAVVLKVLRPRAGRLATQGNVAAASGLEPHHYNYWRREALAYQSGMLERLAVAGDRSGAGVRVPRCYGVDERSDESVWIWLEALDDTRVKPPWSRETFAHVARHLGRLNGAAFSLDTAEAAPPRPDHEWLSRGWLRSWLARWSTVTAGALDPQSWSDPRVRRAFPDPDASLASMQRLAGAQQELLGALDRLPQALSHLDAFSRNVILLGENAPPVLIDWAYLGLAALGEEVAQLVAGTILFGDADRHTAREIGAAALEAYLEGLGDAGWSGDPEVVRFGYAAAAPLRWGAFAVANVFRAATADDERRARIEQETGKPLDATIASEVALATYLLDLAGGATMA